MQTLRASIQLFPPKSWNDRFYHGSRAYTHAGRDELLLPLARWGESIVSQMLHRSFLSIKLFFFFSSSSFFSFLWLSARSEQTAAPSASPGHLWRKCRQTRFCPRLCRATDPDPPRLPPLHTSPACNSSWFNVWSFTVLRVCTASVCCCLYTCQRSISLSHARCCPGSSAWLNWHREEEWRA